MQEKLYNLNLRQATWLELFFDLVFVAVIGVVTHDLAHTHHGHLSAEQLLRFPLVFIPVWWIWATHTVYANHFDNNDRWHRLFALVIMGFLVLLSLFIEESQGETFIQFTLIYAFIRVLMTGSYLRINSKSQERITFTKEMAGSAFIGAVISASAVFFDGITKFIVFYSGILTDMVLQLLFRRKMVNFPIDRKHLVERAGLLVIILLGESVITMISSLSHIQFNDFYAIASAITGFTMLWAVWWIYFDSYNNLERAKRITDGNVLIYTHLILCMGLLILANLIGHSIRQDLDTETFRMLAITGMCGFYLGKQVIYHVCFPPFRKMIYINTAVCITLTIASTFLPRIEFALMGITGAMLFYVYSTFKWLLPNNIDKYLVKGAH